MADDDDKTEEPTDRKLRKAREEGNVPRSEDLNGFIGLAIGILVIVTLSLLYPDKIKTTMGACFESIFVKNKLYYITDKCNSYIQVIAEISLFTFGSGILASFLSYFILYRGFVIPKQPIKFNVQALDIGANMKNLFNKQNAVGLLISILKETFFYGVFLLILLYFFPAIVYQTFCFENCEGNAPLIFIYVIVGAYTIIALIFTTIDVPIKIMFWKSKLKMSHKDIKDEHKETEGAPEVKRAQHEFRHQILQGSPLGAKNATFFVRGSGMIFGIRYNRDESPAPIIVAAGKTPDRTVVLEQTAIKMRRLVIEDTEFIQKLSNMGVVGRPVPLEFVKEIRKCIMELRKFEQEHGPVHPSK